MSEKDSTFLGLEADKIVETIERLKNRIGDRFPDSGLSNVCEHLLSVGRLASQRARWISRPLSGLRLAVALLVILIVVGTAIVPLAVQPPRQAMTLPQFIQVLEAGLNDLVLIGAAVFFLVTLEIRIKRHRALRAIHELRSIAHIIDMHQLTKDPERLFSPGRETQWSPKRTLSHFELGRYLDYCSEMLSLCGKIGVLYIQRFDDPVSIAAVNEVETLCTGLSRKIWQKIMILQARQAPASESSDTS